MKRLFLFLVLVSLSFSTFAVEVIRQASVVTGTTATITWTTDVATGTKAEVTPSNVKIDRQPAKATSTEHKVIISGLHPGMPYNVVFGTARVPLGTNSFSVDDGRPRNSGSDSIPQNAAPPPISSHKAVAVSADKQLSPPPTRKIWGNLPSLQDHFERHGPDFGAKSPDDYAQMAWRFLQRAKAEGLPAKEDEEGVLRIFDAKTGTFASYNKDGTAKTFFKPGSNGYFERQPGRLINLKSLK